mgnify:CR=1 FL=1
MKLLTYSYNNVKSLGCIIDKSKIINVSKSSNRTLPDNLADYLIDFELNNLSLSKIIKSGSIKFIDLKDAKIETLINPKSFRDFYAFRQHVKAGRKSRSLDMIPEYDQFPVFYFSNHNSIIGPGKIELFNKQIDKLDFELEICLIISKHGRNIKAKDAYQYVAGFTILNDWSSRQIQMDEMKLNLGPAKGKDFATSIGPYLVTLDELKDKMIGNLEDLRYDLDMKAFLNNKLVSIDNFKNITWSFSDMIERASYGVDLVPGDLLGSGTCATGCLLEINQINNTEMWLQDGDVVKLKIDRLGELENKVVCIDL